MSCKLWISAIHPSVLQPYPLLLLYAGGRIEVVNGNREVRVRLDRGRGRKGEKRKEEKEIKIKLINIQGLTNEKYSELEREMEEGTLG